MIDLEITPATQYATAYLDGKPVATAHRRRVLDKSDRYAWRVFATDGTLIFGVLYDNSIEYMRKRLERELAHRARIAAILGKA